MASEASVGDDFNGERVDELKGESTRNTRD